MLNGRRAIFVLYIVFLKSAEQVGSELNDLILHLTVIYILVLGYTHDLISFDIEDTYTFLIQLGLN